jgi:Cobyrinic acid a,c-diamide synthase
VEGKVVGENPVVATGKTIRGHEFRYSRMDRARDAGLRTGSPWGPRQHGRMELNAPESYLHTNVCSCPMDRFVEGCREYGGWWGGITRA